MSILPTQTQGSTSSSSLDSPSLNPNPNHGYNLSPSFLSRQFSDPQSPIAPLSDLPAPADTDSAGSSEKVTELGLPNGNISFAQHNGGTHSQSHSSGRGPGPVQAKGKLPWNNSSPRGQQSTGSISSQGGSTHSSGRRAQMMNANHLLNFHYDPISHPQPRTPPPPPPPRRNYKTKPYNKDLFLQANYKFVVLDTGNYASESMDPDKMLKWEDIICVRYSTPFPVQCPICLDYPLCPQITSCGHIFCFPCILQYLLMGEEDHKGDCFKRCPLCFVMVSSKDLYTIYIESVKENTVGDTIDFVLLTRQKDSSTPIPKSKSSRDTIPSSNGDLYDPFTKFTFTTDVELSERKAISDLDCWLAKADSGLVDDLEKLPYVHAAIKQLKHRKNYWNEQQACNKDRLYGYINSQQASAVPLSTTKATSADDERCSSRCSTLSTDFKEENKELHNVMLDDVEPVETQDATLSSSYDGNKSLQRPSNGFRDDKGKNSYNFYQAADGQHLILHPLNMKCLLHHYGSHDMLPHRLSGKILQLDTVTQTEAVRRRFRNLSHFSLTTTFQLCEIDLSEILPPDALSPFMDEIKKREKQRKQLAKKERKDKIKAEVAEAAATHSMLSLSSSGLSSYAPNFSMDDFEALGSSTVISSSPPITGERLLFSNVTRLGFAAAHDSPALKIEETSALHDKATNDSSGSRNSGTPSFANIISKAKSEENIDASKTNESGKKGKKSSRVLLSTASGRRY